MKNKIVYRELSKAEVSENRNIVLSSCSKGGFTIAQQIIVTEANRQSTTVFMKGAFHVNDTRGLYNLRDAINLAIQLSEEPIEDTEEDWDKENKK